jgi:lambda repressor-like predicted transcriptional regulator
MTGLEVKQILLDRGISISKCARDIGVSNCDLNSVLNERKPFYPKYRRLLAEYLTKDIPADEVKPRRKTLKKPSVTLQVRLPQELANLIYDIAEAEGRSVNSVFIELINTAVDVERK